MKIGLPETLSTNLVFLAAALCVAVFLPADAEAQGTAGWNTVFNCNGCSSAEQAHWQAGTLQADVPGLEGLAVAACQADPNNWDTCQVNHPQCSSEISLVQEYTTHFRTNVCVFRDSSHTNGVSFHARWAKTQTAADCDPGKELGPEGHSCVDPKHYLSDAPQYCAPDPNGSNPCDPSNGNKSQVEVDIGPPNAGPGFARYYNSLGVSNSDWQLNPGWRHTYSRALDEKPEANPAVAFAAPANISSDYNSASDACTTGWNDIKGTVRGGALSTGTATFIGGHTCKIEVGGSTAAYLPVRVRHTLSAFTQPSTIKTVSRPNGALVVFEKDGSDWVNELNPSLTLEESGTDWIFTDANDVQETYNSAGKLRFIRERNGQTTVLSYNQSSPTYGGDGNPDTLDRVKGPFGRDLIFRKDFGTGQIWKVESHSGEIWYTNDLYGNLGEVLDQDSTLRKYLYEEPTLRNHLTGIEVNYNRFSTWEYDDAGRAISSEHAGGKERVDFAYNTNGTTTLTMANGASRTYTYGSVQGTQRLTALTGDVCSTCPGGNIRDRDYDANGFLSETTDWEGNVTKMTNNARGLVETLTEAFGEPEQRATTIQWHADYRLPTKVTTPINVTDYTYDTDGNLLTQTISGGGKSRTWTFTYNTHGQPLTIDGPRTDVTDVTTLEYYTCTNGNGNCGQLKKVTNALGHETTYDTYDYAGRLTQMTDPNGLQTTFTYYQRGLPKTVTETPTAGSARTTTFVYDGADLLTRVKTPDGLILDYTYTAAHYLESVTDNLGNKIEYDYDSMGNLIEEDTLNASSTLKRAMDYTRDINYRLDTVNHGGFTSDLTFDLVGNLTSEKDPNNDTTQHTYDALNRLDTTIDALSGVIDYSYDDHDNVTQVVAANGATTTYAYDALDNLTSEVSPDRGTLTYTYDNAGNRKTQTDARSKLTTYDYDALNRLTKITLDGGGTIDYEYDVGTNGKGRLTKITDSTGNTTWTYDNFGFVTQKAQTIGTVTLTTGYGYDGSGRLTSMTLPSGKVVTYGYNDHLADSVTVDGTSILTGATYDPFGPVNGWTWGNSSSHSRAYDLRGLMTSHSIAADTRTLGYDNAGQLTSLSDLRLTDTVDYDDLGRVNSFTHSGTAPLPASQAFTYDANGNRSSITENGTLYSYTNQSNSNRLLSTAGPTAKTNTHDAAGNITNDGTHTFVYDDWDRLVDVDAGSATYAHNGQGQRVKKDSGTATLFAYDEAGRLIGEYDSVGNATQEHVWFSAAPVAVLAGASKHYVHTDQLGTPRAVTDGNTVIWRWESDPFGLTVAQEDPDGDTNVFTYGLRFPGQYFDTETGLHYNYFRTYDPTTGRYLESDPIGLQAGTNTFGYVDGKPTLLIDPLGLCPWCLAIPGVCAGGGCEAIAALAATGGAAAAHRLNSQNAHTSTPVLWPDDIPQIDYDNLSCSISDPVNYQLVPTPPDPEDGCEIVFARSMQECRKLVPATPSRAWCIAGAASRYAVCRVAQSLDPPGDP